VHERENAESMKVHDAAVLHHGQTPQASKGYSKLGASARKKKKKILRPLNCGHGFDPLLWEQGRKHPERGTFDSPPLC